jgi:hypothetical protein
MFTFLFGTDTYFTEINHVLLAFRGYEYDGCLSAMGKKVLMIDADPQPSLSSYYKILEQAQGGLTEILTDPQNVNSYINKLFSIFCSIYFINNTK